MTYVRRLAAIMFTDIVGYTKLMQTDELKALTIRSRHREVFDAAHATHRGEIIQYYGDGTLSIFESAVDAVRCAVEIQTGVLEEPVVPLRIGIHLGDILMDSTDIIGNSVNLASRVESMGIPGAVLISNKVMEEIRNQADLPFQRMGSFHFKNDSHPRDIFALTTPPLVVPRKDQLSGKLEKSSQETEIRSLAVLPFDNYTGDDANEYLVAGIHDNLITTLSQVSSLRVISKTSTLRYKNNPEPLTTIAKELNVDAIVEASVSKISDNVRLNAQLIRVFPEEGHLWADVYDRPISDVYSIFNDVTQTIAEKIHLVLTKKEDVSLSKSKQVDPEAYKAYLKALFHWEKLSPKDFELAKQNLERAISIDPDFAPPYAGLAHTLVGQVQMGLTAPAEAMPKIYQYNMKALSLSPDYAYAHYMNGILGMAVEWNWEKSETSYLKAIDSNPNNSLAHAYYGHLLLILRRFDEAIKEIEIALDLDPNNPLVLSLAGIVRVHHGDHDEALTLGEKSYQIDPNNILTLRVLEQAYFYQAEFDKVIAFQQKMLAQDPVSCQVLEQAYREKGFAYAMEQVARSREKVSETQFVQPGWVAFWFARAGLYEDSMKWVERAFQIHDQDMPYIFVVKEFEPLKQFPQFAAIAEKMKLPYAY